MLKVSFFKSYGQTSPFISKDVSHFLDRIKNGNSEKLISKLRTEPNIDKQKELKKELPIVCFNGTFSNRSIKGLKKSSGLMVLDFDNFENEQQAKQLKEKLKEDESIFSVWFSPRMGVKALYRIQQVTTDKDFKNIYNQIKEIYPQLDPSGKDISRACFESYDPNIYTNLDAEIFIAEVRLEETEIKHDLGVYTNIPIKDQDIIANRLVVWFQSHFDSNNRNTSIFKLASAFNDFGVSEITAIRYCMQYAIDNSKTNEVDKIIKSAYKKTSSFGSKFFEDSTRKKKLTNMVITGKKIKDVEKEFKDIDKDKIESEIKLIKQTVRLDEFWTHDKKGDVKIDPYMFKLYLENLNYFKYYPLGNEKTFIFIKKENNFLENVSEFQMKDKVTNNLIINNQIEVFNLVANQTRLFTAPFLSMIETADISIEKDTKEYALIYYQNTATKIYKDKIEQIDYDDLSGHIWSDQVIKRDYVDTDHHESMFRRFIWLISNQSVDRYNTVKSLIGYLLHSYKNSANNRAIILNDEIISDSANGGSGKGILINAISHMKKLATIDGKSFDDKKSFPYQTVPTDCQVLAFDDVKKNFDFKNLYSIITEGLTIEYKGQDAIKLPVKDSPKVMITTNYTINTDGGSSLRRIFEVELSSYFNADHTPLDEFDCMLFEDWTNIEWSRFDKYMINCLQYYLENGLVSYNQVNLQLKKLINDTSQEFVNWMDRKGTPDNGRFMYSKMNIDFISIYKDFKDLKQRTFNNWIKKYCEYHKIKLDLDGVSNGVRYYEIIKDNVTSFEDENNELNIFDQ